MFPWGLGAIKDRGMGFSLFFPLEKWGESQKMKDGRGEGRKKILFLVLYLLLNHTETLAMQASLHLTVS